MTNNTQQSLVGVDYHNLLVGLPKGIISYKTILTYGLTHSESIRRTNERIAVLEKDGWISTNKYYTYANYEGSHLTQITLMRFND